MAIVAYFEPGFTPQQYDQVLSGLAAKGLQTPTGRQYRVAWNTPQGRRVLNVWDSEETLGKFAEDLMPIIAGTGAIPPEPHIFPVYNIIRGGGNPRLARPGVNGGPSSSRPCGCPGAIPVPGAASSD